MTELFKCKCGALMTWLAKINVDTVKCHSCETKFKITKENTKVKE